MHNRHIHILIDSPSDETHRKKENVNKNIAWKVSITTTANANFPYFIHALITLTLKNCMRFKKTCAYSANEHVHHILKLSSYGKKVSLWMLAIVVTNNKMKVCVWNLSRTSCECRIPHLQ